MSSCVAGRFEAIGGRGFDDLAGRLALHLATCGAGSARASWLVRTPLAPSPLRKVWQFDRSADKMTGYRLSDDHRRACAA